MKYKVFDLRGGVFWDDAFIDAKSSKEAVEKLGYMNVQRDMTNTGNIVVWGKRGTYVYNGIKGGSGNENV